MTDGIIQTTFRKYRLQYNPVMTISELEKELIEKIKQIRDKQYNDGEEYHEMISIFDLIGDNKE